jgi:predicted ATPase
MTAGGEFDARPVRAFLPGPGLRVDESAWPASVAAMAQLLREGLELPAGLTVLVGENGSGKSTVVEVLAGTWEDLNLAVAWRQFMRDPQSYFRHLF